MTISLSRAVFVRNKRRYQGSTLDGRETALVAGLAKPYGEGFAVGAYRIHCARHAGNPGTHRLSTMAHGEELIVAVREGGVVGFVRRDLLWVHPDHRGNGLGPEMAAEMLVQMGCEAWTTEQWQNWLDTPAFTTDGARNRGRMYDVLVRRGVVEDPESSVV
jgi:GNAT superfamily N-acetyltransferase